MTGRILIVDALPTNRIVLRVKLNAAFYEVIQANDEVAALKAVETQRPDLVILSDNLQGVPSAGLCDMLRKRSATQHMPLIVITNSPDPEARLALLNAGADDVICRPIDELVLLAKVRSLLRARDAESELRLREDTQRALGLSETGPSFQARAKIAIVAASDQQGQTLTKGLRALTRDQFFLVSPGEILRETELSPDVVVIAEAEGPDTEGLALLPQLRANALTRNSKIIYVTYPTQRKACANALDMGADDLLTGGPVLSELALRIKKQVDRKRVSDKLRADMRDGLRAAVVDPLTGLYNRRYAMPHLRSMAERAERRDKPYALLLADIDHFKKVNDKYGHSAGDSVLVHLSRLLQENLRAADLLARFGGEEFLIAMPDTSRIAAKRTAERLCKTVLQAAMPIALDVQINISLSIGVAISRAEPTGDRPEHLINAADQALYAAKNAGRNMVVMADTVTRLRPPPPLDDGSRHTKHAARTTPKLQNGH